MTLYLFVLPLGILFVLFFIAPIVYALFRSVFCSQRSSVGLGGATISFNGVGNYVDVFHDSIFTVE